MKDKNEYEKHLAEQLNQLPAPGSAQEHWPAMKALLDRDMPEGGAAGRWKRPGTWGLIALVAGILFMTVWYFTPSSEQQQQAVVQSTLPGTGTQALPETRSNNKAVITTGEKATAAAIPDPVTANKTVSASPAESVQEEPEPSVLTDESLDKKTVAKAVKESGKKGTENSTALPVSAEGISASQKKERPGRSSSRPVINGENTLTATAIATAAPSKQKDRKSGSADAGRENNPASQSFSLPDASSGRAAKASLPRIPARIPLPISGVNAEDSIYNNYAYALIPEPAPAPPRSRFPKETERTRALKNRVVGTGEDKNFVFGLTLPLALPISDQKTVAYNFNGGVNKITDYLPAPHAQYHFNDRSFLQTELHFFAPQYIRPALVYQQTQPMNTGNFTYKTKSIYTEKLYYFSVPVSAYYSPFRNFYLGTGMQFSSLISGIARFEEKATNAVGPSAGGQLLSNSYRSFRKDSVSALLDGNEFRLLLDANYYWKKFTLGMRYNQALGNYVGLRVNAFTPYYADRNKSLQFYLRYNLWENRKKKPAIMAYRW